MSEQFRLEDRNGEVLLNDSMDEIRARINEHFAG